MAQRKKEKKYIYNYFKTILNQTKDKKAKNVT